VRNLFYNERAYLVFENGKPRIFDRCYRVIITNMLTNSFRVLSHFFLSNKTANRWTNRATISS